MKLSNAIKKLAKHGEVKQNGSVFWVSKNGERVEFMRNGKIEDDYDIVCIRVCGDNDKDDSMIDYSAGVWCDNLSQAIRLARF